ncbi:MAG TPA: coenzyme F420-0:L-glutamate ligase [Micromonosporaceae bacterium]
MSGPVAGPPNDGLRVLPVRGIGEVQPGADLASLIATAAPWLEDGDVLVVTSKIVSKAEGRLVDVPQDGPDRVVARDEVLTAESAREVARRGHTRIVQTHHGFVMASAGVDASNVERTRLVLLPKDPDASARALRQALRERHGLDVAVVVSDTMGRPWRNGLTDVALGAAGIAGLRDHRGEIDPYGNELHLTQMAVIDELAAAGELVKGKTDQVPVAVVRGYLAGVAGADGDGEGAAALVRPADQDLFSQGTAEARAAGLRAAAMLPEDPTAAEPRVEGDAGPRAPAAPGALDVAAVDRAVALAASGTEATFQVLAGGQAVACTATAGDVAAAVRLGMDVQRLRAALAAEGLASRPDPAVTAANGRPVVMVRLFSHH